MNFIRLRYSGAKPYRDSHMGLRWEPGAEQLVTQEAARKLLRFIEFSKADETAEKAGKPAKASKAADQARQDADVQAVTLAAQQAAQHEQQQADMVDAVLLEVDGMDKDALGAFAKRYEVELDKRRSVEALRLQVSNLVEQFGVLG